MKVGGEAGRVEGTLKPLLHRASAMNRPPLSIVVVAEQGLRPDLERLPHHEQKPFERLDRGRDFVPLEPRDPRLAGPSAMGKSPLGQAMATSRIANEIPGGHIRMISDHISD
jgi:hypothetical protein